MNVTAVTVPAPVQSGSNCTVETTRLDCSKRKVLSLEWNWCEDRASRGEESVAVPNDGGAEGCRSCFGREFQSTGAWWVKDLSVTLRRERTEGRCRVMITEDPSELYGKIEHWEGCGLHSVEIRRLFWLKNFVFYRSNFILDALLNFEPVVQSVVWLIVFLIRLRSRILWSMI